MLFFVLYIIEYLIFPKELVTIIAGKNTHRIRLIGEIVNSLAFFFCLNRFLLHKSMVDFFIILCCIIIYFMLGFRIMLAAAFVSSAILFFRLFCFAIKKILVASIFLFTLGVILSQTKLVQNTVEDMMSRQETDSYSNDDYIRLAQLAYYMDFHFNSEVERLFGSGHPNPSSSYGKFMEYDEDDRNAMLKSGYNDWGLIGQSWLVGPITIIIFVLMMVKCVIVSWKGEKKYYYIGAWYIFLLLISVNNMEVLRQGSMAYHALIFYLVTYLSAKQKLQKSLQNK